jgi:hypothetical protein
VKTEFKGLAAGSTPVDDVFESARNYLGFSIGAYPGYSKDVSRNSRQRKTSGMTALLPGTFLDFGKKKPQFRIDVGAGIQFALWRDPVAAVSSYYQ